MRQDAQLPDKVTGSLEPCYWSSPFRILRIQRRKTDFQIEIWTERATWTRIRTHTEEIWNKKSGREARLRQFDLLRPCPDFDRGVYIEVRARTVEWVTDSGIVVRQDIRLLVPRNSLYSGLRPRRSLYLTQKILVVRFGSAQFSDSASKPLGQGRFPARLRDQFRELTPPPRA